MTPAFNAIAYSALFLVGDDWSDVYDWNRLKYVEVIELAQSLLFFGYNVMAG